MAVYVLINLPAYWHVSADQAILNTLSSDEGAYYGWLQGFYDSLQNGAVWAVLTFKDPWGYGSLFWYSYGLLNWPIHALGSFTYEIIFLRIISAAWLGIAAFFIYKIIYNRRQNHIIALLSALTLLTAPAYYFYFKAFSAEFMTLAVGMASIYYVVKDDFVGGRNYLIAVTLLGIAIGLKVSLLIFLPIYGLYMVWVYRQRSLTAFIKFCALAGSGLGIGFVACNPYVVLEGRTGLNYFVSMVLLNMNDNATGHGASIVGIDYQAWYNNVITPEFYPAVLLIVFLIAYGLVIVTEYRQKRYTALLLLSLALLYSLYIIVTVKKLWLWYLFPGMALLPLGLFLIPWQRYSRLKKYWKYEPVLLSLVLLAATGLQADAIQAKYQEFTSRDTSTAIQDKTAAKEEFDRWLIANQKSDLAILKSPYIYFDPAPYTNISIIPIVGSMEPTSFASFHPDLLLIEKNYGFLRPDAEIKDMTSYPQLVAERDFFTQLTTTGATLNDTLFTYELVLETAGFYVYERK